LDNILPVDDWLHNTICGIKWISNKTL
jgi:hypothetical protein